MARKLTKTMGRIVEAGQTGVRNCRGGYGFTSCTSTAQTTAFLPSHGGYINVGLIPSVTSTETTHVFRNVIFRDDGCYHSWSSLTVVKW